MKKRFFSIFIVVAFLLTIMLGVNGCSKEEDPETTGENLDDQIEATESFSEEDFEEQMALQMNAGNANEVLMDAFGYDEDGNPAYPDEYAGAYIEKDKLIVALVGLDDEMMETYRSYLRSYAAYAEFIEAEYSYNYLKEKADELVEELDGIGAHVTEWYVGQKENQIEIGVLEEDLEEVQEYVDQLKLEYPVLIKESEYAQLL